jgi:hypothetical protein
MSVTWDAYGVTYVTNGYTTYQESPGFGSNAGFDYLVASAYTVPPYWAPNTYYYNTMAVVGFAMLRFAHLQNSTQFYVDDVLVGWTGYVGYASGYQWTTASIFVPKGSSFRYVPVGSTQIDRNFYDVLDTGYGGGGSFINGI